MKRLIIVYNPRSSKQKRIRPEVIDKARKIGGVIVGKFEVQPTNVDDNAKKLSEILQDDDLVVVAGGDGTASIAMNGVALTQAKQVKFATLPYGNFNDMARMFKMHNLEEIMQAFEAKKIKKVYPLEIIIDGKFFRYVMCYLTVGMFAESTELFDKPSNRKKLKKGKKSFWFSVFTLATWYFKNAKKKFLPDVMMLDEMSLNNKKRCKDGRKTKVVGGRVSDILFVNGETVARVMKGGKYAYHNDKFLVSAQKLSNIFKLGWFMLKSMVKGIPGEEKIQSKLCFEHSMEVELQIEGEYTRRQVKEIEVRKSKKPILVVAND